MSETRMSRDELFMRIASLVAKQTTCRRRAVGCVLVDDRNRILATGYNGVPAGAPHCLDHPCPAAGAPSGTNLTGCEAIHAEQNAILLLNDPWKVRTAYVTTFPCDSCIKLLLGTSCERIVFRDDYPHEAAYVRWEKAGRQAVHFGEVRTNPFGHPLSESGGSMVSPSSKARVFGQWDGFNRVLAHLQTLEGDHVNRKELYEAVLEMRPEGVGLDEDY